MQYFDMDLDMKAGSSLNNNKSGAIEKIESQIGNIWRWIAVD